MGEGKGGGRGGRVLRVCGDISKHNLTSCTRAVCKITKHNFLLPYGPLMQGHFCKNYEQQFPL
jgi:hypothetical protein